MALIVHLNPCITVECDFCGEGDNTEYGGSFHYESEDEARKAVLDADWRIESDGRLKCAGCIDNEAYEAKESIRDAP